MRRRSRTASECWIRANDILTHFYEQEDMAGLQRTKLEGWQAKARQAAEEASKLPEGSTERARSEQLAKRALASAEEARSLLAIAEAGVAAGKPQADKAEEMLQRWGIQKEQIRSAKTRLHIEAVSAEGQLKLAQAAMNGGAETAQGLLAQAEGKVSALKAKARAGQTIAETMPLDEADAAAEIDLGSRDRRVNDAFAKLMADVSGTAPAAAAQTAK